MRRNYLYYKDIPHVKVQTYLQAPINFQQILDAEAYTINFRCSLTERKQYINFFCFDLNPHQYNIDLTMLNFGYENSHLFSATTANGWSVNEMDTNIVPPFDDTPFDLKFEFTGDQYISSYKLATDTTYTAFKTTNSSRKLTCNLTPSECYFTMGYFSLWSNNYQLYGSIYMDNCYIETTDSLSSGSMTTIWRGWQDNKFNLLYKTGGYLDYSNKRVMFIR